MLATDPDATVVRLPPAALAGRAPVGTPALPDAAALALPAGFALHEYRIERVLGQGGFGITYLATDVHLSSAVAIKEYLPSEIAFRTGDLSVSPAGSPHRERYRQGLESFLAEARTLAALRHSAIVRVSRFFEAHRTAYMVLAYEAGQPLKTWWPQHFQTLGERGLIDLLVPLFDGLEAVHAAGFLHRDIKPDNIQVRSTDGRLVLLDFGSAAQALAVADDGAVVLTPGYAPPEQYDPGGAQGAQGPWTDVYALAATLYWCVAAKKPPDAELRVLDPGRHKAAVQVGAGRFGNAFLQAIDAGLALSAAQRPQSVAEFRRLLCADHVATLSLDEALRRGQGAEAASDSTPTTSQPPGWRARVGGRVRGRLAPARWRPRDWPLAPKLTAALVATALLPMLLVGGWNLQGATEALTRAELANVEGLARSTAARVGQFVQDGQHMARGLASDESIVALMAAPPTDNGLREAALASLNQRLLRIVQADPDVQLLMVLGPAGTVLASSDPEVLGRPLAFRDYFQAAIAGRPALTGVVIGAVAGASGVVAAEPVRASDGRVVGVLALRLLGSTVDKVLQEARRSTPLTLFLVDGDGVVVLHPQPEWALRSLSPLSVERQAALRADQRFRRERVESLGEATLATALAQRQAGHVVYDSVVNQRSEIAGFAPVPGFDGTVVVSESQQAFEAPMQQLRTRLWWTAAGVGLLFAGLALALARSIVGPVRGLTQAASALQGGDFEAAASAARIGPRRDELGLLARTFAVMIDVLRARERGRKDGAA